MNAATAIDEQQLQPESARIARPRAFGFDVPEWAHFVAIDREGRAFAFACEPTRFDRWGIWNNDGLGGRMECIGDFDTQVENWHGSLLRFDARGFWTPVLAYHIDRDLEPLEEGRPSQAPWVVAFGLVLVVGAIVLARLAGLLP